MALRSPVRPEAVATDAVRRHAVGLGLVAPEVVVPDDLDFPCAMVDVRDLAAWLKTPDAPDVADDVRARLAAPARRRRRWRYYLAVALVAVLVAVLPPGRAALADAPRGGHAVTPAPTRRRGAVSSGDSVTARVSAETVGPER